MSPTLVMQPWSFDCDFSAIIFFASTATCMSGLPLLVIMQYFSGGGHFSVWINAHGQTVDATNATKAWQWAIIKWRFHTFKKIIKPVFFSGT
jgi:hypothetical protein